MKGHGAKGLKCSDLRAIPLCHTHHLEVHQIGRDSFARKHMLDYEIVIEALNKFYEKINSMTGEN